VKENFSNRGALIMLKSVLLGIYSPLTIDQITPHIREHFMDVLIDSLKAKSASEDLFEIYFLIMDLSELLVPDMYDPKVLKKALKRVQTSEGVHSVFPRE
jgi:hypothetical protein